MLSHIYFSRNYDDPKREHQEDVAVLEMEDEVYKLVLWNDDVNTFDFVIVSLIEICGHTLEPVSYTHLDVYKRQASRSPASARSETAS